LLPSAGQAAAGAYLSGCGASRRSRGGTPPDGQALPLGKHHPPDLVILKSTKRLPFVIPTCLSGLVA